MKPLRILFNAYPTHCQGGGAVVKMRKLKEHLQKAGHTVDFFDPWRTPLGSYDLYHHFSWFSEDLPMLACAKGEGLPVVVETMYWDSLRYAFCAPVRGAARRARAVLRYALKAALPRLAPGRRALARADLLMANSQLEARLLARHFRLDPAKVAVAFNGVDRRFRDAAPEPFVRKTGLKDFVLMTGLVEPRKNALGLIRALRGTGVPVVLVGGCPGVHRWYYSRCKQEAGPEIRFIDALDHDDPLLASAYAAARVLAVPSWHETTAKSALEAALAGRNVVMTTYAPAAREYLGDKAFYADPGDPSALRKTVLKAMEAPPPADLQRHVERNFLWEKVVGARLEAYERLGVER